MTTASRGPLVGDRIRTRCQRICFRKCIFRKMHFSKILQIFGGLVLGCIKTKFCKKICVRQHFSSSTRFASFCTAAISKFSQKNRFEKTAIFVKFQQKIANVAKFANFVKFQKCQLENLVDFEKCCKTHIFLQKSELIQPKTSNILPKFCQPTARPRRRRPRTGRPRFIGNGSGYYDRRLRVRVGHLLPPVRGLGLGG